MCRYRYIYYSACSHGELTLFDYCDKAKAYFAALDQSPNPSHDIDTKDAGTSSRSFPRQAEAQFKHQPPEHILPHRRRQWFLSGLQADKMSAISETETDTAAELHHDSSQRHQAPDPQPAQAASTTLHHGTSHYTSEDEHNPHSPSGRTVEMHLPHDAVLTMEFKTNDGKVKEIVAQFESKSMRGGGDYDEYLSDDLDMRVGRTDDESTRRGSTTVHHSSGETRPMGHDFPELPAPSDEASPRSPRKPIPSQWFPKAPLLKTAQRAMERQSRKTTTQTDAHNQAGAKTIRRAHGSPGSSRAVAESTFLTKEASATVEGNITTPPSSTKADGPRQGSLNRSSRVTASSPRRMHAKQDSTIRVTISPTRVSKESTSSPSARRVQTVRAAHAPGDGAYSGVEGTYVSGRPLYVPEAGSDSHLKSTPSSPLQRSQQIAASNSADPKTVEIAKSPKRNTPKLTLRIPNSRPGLHEASDSAGPATSSNSDESVLTAVQISKIPRMSSPTRATAGEPSANILGSSPEQSAAVKGKENVPREPAALEPFPVFDFSQADASKITGQTDSLNGSNDFHDSHHPKEQLADDASALTTTTRPSTSMKTPHTAESIKSGTSAIHVPSSPDTASSDNATHSGTVESSVPTSLTSDPLSALSLPMQDAQNDSSHDNQPALSADSLHHETWDEQSQQPEVADRVLPVASSKPAHRVHSTRTVKAISPDAVLADPAVLYTRKNAASRTQDQVPEIATTELSPHSSRSSELRATAPDFVPMFGRMYMPNQSHITAPHPALANFEYGNYFPQGYGPTASMPYVNCPPVLDRHNLYKVVPTIDTPPISHALDTFPAESNKKKKHPRKKGGNRGRKSTSESQQAAETSSTGQTQEMNEPSGVEQSTEMSTGHEHTVQATGPVASPDTQANETGPKLQNVESTGLVTNAFGDQFDKISASRRFNTLPAGGFSNREHGDYNSHRRGYRESRQHGFNGLYADSRSRRSQATSGNGIPLSGTVPFPDPIPPTPNGPRSSTVHGGQRKAYVGYVVPATPNCGVYDIEFAAEYGGGACHKCQSW